MTKLEWEQRDAELEKALQDKRLAVKTAITLTTKLALLEEEKALKADLHNHRLNYYELVKE